MPCLGRNDCLCCYAGEATLVVEKNQSELLVVNFCHASEIDETVHPSDGIGVVHIIVDKGHHSQTSVVFRKTSVVHLGPIVVLEHSQSSYTPCCGAYLDSPNGTL